MTGTNALRVTAPAKVNLYLGVGGVRPDGYHEVVTVLQAVDFGDEVVLVPDAPFAFACNPDLGINPADNLALRAARAMATTFAHPLDISIAVEKHVPAGAGLGGASSDAAAVICGLAELWRIDRTDGRLPEVARSLGADIPFFLEGGAALFTERGDVLERRLRPLEAAVVLVKPDEPVLTREAYAAFDRLGAPGLPATDGLIDALDSGDAAAVATRLYNAMTPASTVLVPAIAEAMNLLAGQPGVLGHAMAGSGSAVFGICADAASAEACAATARAAGLWAIATQTHPRGCTSGRF